MSSSIKVRSWSQLTYHPIKELLPKLRALQIAIAASDTTEKIRNLRTHKLARYREGWNACIFLKGISTVLNYSEMSFALNESQDYDLIGRTVRGDEIHYTPIQLKEYRGRLGGLTLEQEIQKIQKKYKDSSDLVVAFYLSGTDSFDLTHIHLPKLNIASLWFFGCTSKDQTEWVLIGDMLRNPVKSKYKIA